MQNVVGPTLVAMSTKFGRRGDLIAYRLVELSVAASSGDRYSPFSAKIKFDKFTSFLGCLCTIGVSNCFQMRYITWLRMS